jgi:hypothetical protein
VRKERAASNGGGIATWLVVQPHSRLKVLCVRGGMSSIHMRGVFLIFLIGGQPYVGFFSFLVK